LPATIVIVPVGRNSPNSAVATDRKCAIGVEALCHELILIHRLIPSSVSIRHTSVKEKDTIMNTKLVAYWVTTALVAFFIGSGGAAELAQVPGNVEGLAALGYPAYFVMLIGLWKVLGAIAVLVPRFPRLKEWAYAGMFFNMTGAAVSTVVVFGSDEAWHVVVQLLMAALVVTSWALRPPSRVLGTLIPGESGRARSQTSAASTVPAGT
jgi:uncharacterized membrane protein YphA (DoxX/SURF4 family)